MQNELKWNSKQKNEREIKGFEGRTVRELTFQGPDDVTLVEHVKGTSQPLYVEYTRVGLDMQMASGSFGIKKRYAYAKSHHN